MFQNILQYHLQLRKFEDHVLRKTVCVFIYLTATALFQQKVSAASSGVIYAFSVSKTVASNGKVISE